MWLKQRAEFHRNRRFGKFASLLRVLTNREERKFSVGDLDRLHSRDVRDSSEFRIVGVHVTLCAGAARCPALKYSFASRLHQRQVDDDRLLNPVYKTNLPSSRRKDIIDAGGVDVCRSRREIQRARVQTHQHMEGRTSTLDTWVIALHIGGACTEAGHVR